MSSSPKTILELPKITSISSNDLILVEQVSSNNSTTSAITGSNLKKSIIKGPYSNDTNAAIGNVEIGQLYYTSTGEARVRLV